MKKTLIVVAGLVAFSYAAFIPPDGVSKMPVERVTVHITTPVGDIHAKVSGIEKIDVH